MSTATQSSSLPGLAEDVLKDVVEAVASDVEYLLDAFMPDGRPFGMEKLSEADQLQKYLDDGLHDDPEAAANWIRGKIDQLIQMLKLFGVDDARIASVHPYNIVEAAAFIWSEKMENLLRERGTAPLAPPDPQTMIEGQAWQAQTIQ